VKGGVKVNYFEETRIRHARWDPRSAGLVEVVERDTLSFLKNLKKYAETDRVPSNLVLPCLLLCGHETIADTTAGSRLL